VIYNLLFRFVLQRMDAEAAHRCAGRVLGATFAIPGVRRLASWLLRPRDRVLETAALGCTFATPLGVAAGMDKDGSWFGNLLALGFGFVEVGTVTSLPQPGNMTPRIFRFPAAKALVNSMGFPNPGAETVAARLGHRRPGVVGANIGKTKALAIEDVVDDYRCSARVLAGSCDYLVVNVSSPNTPGLLAMQDVARLRELLLGIKEELATTTQPPPLLIKLGPDLADQEIDELAKLALDLKLDGIVAINTSIDVSFLGSSAADSGAVPPGGISGAPLRFRAREVLRRIRATVGDELVLISVGGIDSAEEAWERILAGATLVQAYSAFVYGGPLWAYKVNKGLRSRTLQVGASRIQDLVGTGSPTSVLDRQSIAQGDHPPPTRGAGPEPASAGPGTKRQASM